jgi:hypothetical protein
MTGFSKSFQEVMKEKTASVTKIGVERGTKILQ